MDSSSTVLYSAAGLPALISTGITFIYFFLKLCRYIFDAISHQAERRVAMATSGCCQQEHSTDMGEEGHTQICKQIPGNLSEQYGRRTQRPSGSIFLPRRGQDICLPSIGNASRHTEQSTFRENAEGLQSREHQNPENYNGKGPDSPCVNPTGILTKRGSRDHASDEQSRSTEGNGREGNHKRSDQVLDDGISGCRVAEPAQNARTTKTQVNTVALQTDSCDTLYVTKNTLIAYTIAIIQNTQALQYDQMHIALQTARNQASLEMPIRAEELMSAHFNLAILSNETNINQTVDAKKSEATVLDADPSTSIADEETYVKIPSRQNTANRDPQKQHPTEAVAPTCRRDYGLVNGIPAGYETDDSWDHDSLTHEQEHTHTHAHNIVPLLALRTWSNPPNRGCEQPHRQNNHINVRSGHAPYPRPWDNQPYRWRTRSQQALHARAYRKIERRYPLQ